MPPKISSAEWEVMNVLWEKGSMTANEVFENLPLGHGWKSKTVNTFLTRLVEKKVLSSVKKDRAFIYSACVSRDACVQQESESFLQRVFKGATGDLVLHFCAKADLSPEDIRELERFIKSKKSGK